MKFGVFNLVSSLLLLGAARGYALELKSPDIVDGAAISRVHYYPRCGGENKPPTLYWSDAPTGTTSFVVTLIDETVTPSAWSHWVVKGIPAGERRMENGRLAGPAKGVISNFGSSSYSGPCPPKGSGLHSYVLTLYAFEKAPRDIEPDANAIDLNNRLSGAATAFSSIKFTADDQASP